MLTLRLEFGPTRGGSHFQVYNDRTSSTKVIPINTISTHIDPNMHPDPGGPPVIVVFLILLTCLRGGWAFIFFNMRKATVPGWPFISSANALLARRSLPFLIWGFACISSKQVHIFFKIIIPNHNIFQLELFHCCSNFQTAVLFYFDWTQFCSVPSTSCSSLWSLFSAQVLTSQQATQQCLYT